jgi:hypothetical protein
MKVYGDAMKMTLWNVMKLFSLNCDATGIYIAECTQKGIRSDGQS